MLVGSRDTGEYPRRVDYQTAVLDGSPRGNGLYVPTEIPEFVDGELENLSGHTYANVSAHVQHMWAPEVPRPTMQDIAHDAYSKEVFTKATRGQIAPVSWLEHNLYRMELGLGPTLAFKDVALQFLGRMFDRYLGDLPQKKVIIGATSGDTGSAAIEAVRPSAWMRCVILSPEKGPTPFQSGQMGIRSDWQQIHNLRVKGTFDECQDIVKDLLSDPDLQQHLSVMNSINWGRIIAQIPYSVSGYLQTMVKTNLPVGSPIDVVVPTGNFGDALSVFYAREMGVPIRTIYIATNENDVMHRLVSTGVYAAREVQSTSSPSMDISKASNFERLAFHILKNSPHQTKAYMEIFAAKGWVEFSDFGVDNLVLRALGFGSGASDHQSRLEMIRRMYLKSGQIIDPHTADAASVAVHCAPRDIPTLIYSTADQMKFPEIIAEALGSDKVPPRDPNFEGIEAFADSGFRPIANQTHAVKNYLLDTVLADLV